jgi:ABC-type glutathione transport system ATPase component
MSDDDESFIILGSTPTASMDFGESMSHRQQPQSMTLNGPSSSMKPSMQVSTNTAANFSLLNGSQNQQNGQASVVAEGLNGVSMSNSIASRFLCGEVSRDEVMQVIKPLT